MQTDIFKIEVQLASLEYVPVLSVEASFKLTDEGPAQLCLDLIYEIVPPDAEPHSLVFTTDEVRAIRFAVADAIEKKYWSGEYRGAHA